MDDSTVEWPIQVLTSPMGSILVERRNLGFGDKRKQQHPGEITRSSDQKGMRKTVVLHNISDNQRPDRAGQAAGNIVNRKSGHPETSLAQTPPHASPHPTTRS